MGPGHQSYLYTKLAAPSIIFKANLDEYFNKRQAESNENRRCVLSLSLSLSLSLFCDLAFSILCV